jgi:outer membrane protein assembly factor BamA
MSWLQFRASALFVISLSPVGVVASRAALAEEATAPAPTALPPRRYELAGFPIFGGNTDIGFQFGGVGTFTRFYDQAFPYEWNIDLLLSASVKDDQGFRLIQQSHVLRLDAPDLLLGRLRLDTRASYQRTINAGYFGIGNAAPALASENSHRYEYVQEEGRVRAIARFHTRVQGLDFALATNLRAENPTVYAASNNEPSKLGEDTESGAGTPPVLGGQSAFLGGLAAGVMFDTRDSEFVTRRGVFYQAGVGDTIGSAEGVAYGSAGMVLAHYAPLPGPFVFASRFVADFQFGRVPFYDLAQGGIFEPQYLLGSETGVRGVPFGRYAGRVKLVTNLEVRATPFPRFTIFGERFRIGTTTFFDAGRVWSDYSVVSAADGYSLGLKYGIGGGLFIQWGEAAIFRIEAAYSPDAISENSNLPVGIYVSDGLMF